MRTESHLNNGGKTAMERNTSSGVHHNRILIVDDAEMIATTLAFLMSFEPSLEVVGNAINGMEALGKVKELRPDLVLMDVRMPVMDGIEATRRITAEFPETIVIGLTSWDPGGFREMMLEAGASHFLEKVNAAGQLVPMILGAIASRNAKRSV